MPKLLSVNTGQIKDIATKSGRTGHFKKGRVGAVTVTELGLSGDCIVDTEHHGGVDQAVYIFDQSDMDWWAATLDRSFEPGAFGENLTVSGMPTENVAVGDRFAIGEVLLEVTSPRIPCVTLSAVMGEPAFPKRFLAAERCGYYTRVVSVGEVAAGMEISWLKYEAPRRSVTDMLPGKSLTPLDKRQLLQTPLHYKARAEFGAELQ